MPALLGVMNKTTSGYFPYVKSTKNTARYASLMLSPGQARLFEKRGIMDTLGGNAMVIQKEF